MKKAVKGGGEERSGIDINKGGGKEIGYRKKGGKKLSSKSDRFGDTVWSVL